MKASEKQTLCKKLVTVLKKRYQQPLPQTDRAVLDVILYGICLENVPETVADASFERLLNDFHDYNELRVSSLTELEQVFRGVGQAEYRALRVRTVLQDIFENLYSFDFDGLRKKTLDAAGKQLNKLRHLSDFVRRYTLQTALGAHTMPLDHRSHLAVVWLGLVTAESSEAQAAEEMKSALRKSDAPLFSHLLRCLATDPKLVKAFESAVAKIPDEGFEPKTAVERLEELFRTAGKSPKGMTPKKEAAKPASLKKKAPAKKTASTKKASKKPAKSSGKKPPAAVKKKSKAKRSVKSRS